MTMVAIAWLSRLVYPMKFGLGHQRLPLPTVTTTAATNVTSSSATLNGTVNPNGLTTSVYFQYGTTSGYGITTASQNYTGNMTQMSVRTSPG